MSTATPAKEVNLVVATPCFGGQLSVLYAASLFKLQQAIRRYSGLTSRSCSRTAMR